MRESKNPRIASIDIVRGVAVMGILAANIAAFALPQAAYFSPLAWGGTTPADLAVWAANFILVEGKMRGLFSFLFGASLLIATERAEAAGRNPFLAHSARMAVLFAFGLAHLYLIWWGDILAHYALVGMAAYMFRQESTRTLILLGIAALLLSLGFGLMGWLALLDSASLDSYAKMATWNEFARGFGVPLPTELAREVEAYRGPWIANLRYRLANEPSPFAFLHILGPETLSAMLFGMAAYKSGLLRGEWPIARVRRWALGGTAISVAGYALLAANTLAWRFDMRAVYFASIVGSAPLRVAGIVGYAAALVWLIAPTSAAGRRLAAVGRAAFTNYLGTSILVTAIFYGWGLGQFGMWSRAQIYAVPLLVWALMLLWSKPWLERFRFGPFEWLWRSLARGRLQPMRR